MKTKKAKIVKVIIPEGKLYEMVDKENESLGLLVTNLPIKKLEKEWRKHYNNDKATTLGVSPLSDRVSPFVEQMKKKYRGSFFTFERAFCEATIYP